ncbi:methylenetetrahydrofolate reductase [NAD(P)H] [Engelhardtia mirabilis]|uniref:Methylenetetrahydrofolate reductase n=1 Tax=Engelhardtia mirabilis TaxID=2528011 RepID=A0A518BHP4_9BACT|nr:5,10-methylenetetrahydrofolate reductase [Planctomycetes bacterium Pla133]QDV00817.1 5,10-methylenetetrahydrofolate reductase [Planctomycetes bacterium Pla86]
MRISQMHGLGAPVFSFEFFPPKTPEAVEELVSTVAELRDMHTPDFVSVTYGAGGSTRETTLATIARIQNELKITAMAHLTCVGHTAAELKTIVQQLVDAGVENILALRGDPPKGETEFTRTSGGFGYASELVGFLQQNFDVCIGGACYPECHPESKTRADDLDYARQKVAAGASHLTTQLFFENRDYFEYVERARKMGIEVPIVPGIMPITNVKQIQRFTKMCGAQIPEALLGRLERVADDPGAVMAIGIEHAILQCRDLIAGGAPGVHFYTLNKSYATRSILAALRGLRTR